MYVFIGSKVGDVSALSTASSASVSCFRLSEEKCTLELRTHPSVQHVLCRMWLFAIGFERVDISPECTPTPESFSFYKFGEEVVRGNVLFHGRSARLAHV